MGMSTITAARILKGQREGSSGEEAKLTWENFPSIALAQVIPKNSHIIAINITDKYII